MSADIEDQNGAYALDYVRGYLSAPKFFVTDIHLKVFSTLGDQIAVAVLKALYPDWQMDRTKLRKIIVAVCASLEHPGAVKQELDRIPAVTMCLLEILMLRVQSPEEKEMILAAMEAVRKYTTMPTDPSE